MTEPRITTNSRKPVQLARGLAEQGQRLFSLNDARKAAERIPLDIKDMKRVLLLPKAQGWIHALKRDLYGLNRFMWLLY